jgi:hypothetical protein
MDAMELHHPSSLLPSSLPTGRGRSLISTMRKSSRNWINRHFQESVWSSKIRFLGCLSGSTSRSMKRSCGPKTARSKTLGRNCSKNNSSNYWISKT